MEPKIFDTSDVSGYLEHLREEGYVVIGNVLDESTRKSLMEQFWTDWETSSPNFKRHDKSTWKIENSPMMFGKGMAIFSGLPHSDFMWRLRLRTEIMSIFAHVHKTCIHRIVTSFDGFSVFFTKKQKSSPWLHTDQNPNNDSYCVQGQYNFLPVKKDSAGFVVVPRSHTINLENTTKNDKDWVPVSDTEFEGVKLIIPENCFTLWNSRTIHANTGMTTDEIRFDRLTCYITYLPRSTRPQDVLDEKIKAYKNSDGTSHWANRCEVKKYPWGFKPTYEKRGFNKIVTKTLTKDRLFVM